MQQKETLKYSKLLIAFIVMCFISILSYFFNRTLEYRWLRHISKQHIFNVRDAAPRHKE